MRKKRLLSSALDKRIFLSRLLVVVTSLVFAALVQSTWVLIVMLETKL